MGKPSKAINLYQTQGMDALSGFYFNMKTI